MDFDLKELQEFLENFKNGMTEVPTGKKPEDTITLPKAECLCDSKLLLSFGHAGDCAWFAENVRRSTPKTVS